MLFAAVIFSASDWLWYLAVVMLLALVLMWWSYRSAPQGLLRWVCPLLKALGFATLLLCLLEPMESGQRARPGANLFAVVADNSAGMQIKDAGSEQSRGDSLRALLDSRHGRWQETLEDNFEVRRYLFDSRLQNTRDFSDLTLDGRASAIGSALRTIQERFHGRPLAGVLLLTDGNATDWRTPPDLAGLPPVYPVVIGSLNPVRDLSIQQARATQSVFEDAPVSVQADVSANGFRGETVVGRLLDASGHQVSQQTLDARKTEDLLAFRFQLKPEQPGLSFYQLSVRAESELNTGGKPQPSREATLANNSTVLAINRGRGPHRILYVAGRPNWEFKFLNRAIQEDDQLQLVSLIRVARREPKFNFMGRAGESSNPLFRGFGNQEPDEVERYDKPVLIRLNTRDEFELRSGFPSTAEDLYSYEAVVVADLEAEFFTPDQAALLQRYVSERGGGFLMLGGMESFQEGKYQHTPIGDMLPVYLDPIENTNPPGEIRLDLTKEGWLQPWARLRDNEVAEGSRIKSMAPFLVLNRVREVKPGASVIATVTDATGVSRPGLVIQQFGRGRTAALTVGDVWRWGLHSAEAHRDMDKAWRQLMRRMVSDVPSQVQISAEPKSDDSSGAMRLQVRVRDPKYQPLDNATVALEVQPVMTDAAGAQTNTVRLQVEPSAEQAGLYEATYLPRFTGGYKASVCVTNQAGVEVGRADTGWSTDLAAEEFRSLTPNVALLEEIARKTGGKVIRPSDLESFARDLPRKQAPVMEPWVHPVWNTPAVFAFAIACLVAEWGLRRWKGMA